MQQQVGIWKTRAWTTVLCTSLLALSVFGYAVPGNSAEGNKGANSARAVATESPIKHIIILIGENRGLDHTFGVYKPKGKGQTISNILSKGIVNEDGTPGPNYSLALQYAVSPQPSYYIGAPNSAKTPYNTTTSLIPQPNTNGAPSAQSAIRAPFQTIAQASVEPDIQPQYVFLLTTGATGLPPGVLDTRVPGAGKLQSGPFVARARYHRRRLCRRHDAPLLPGNTTAGLQSGQRDQGQPDRLFE